MKQINFRLCVALLSCSLGLTAQAQTADNGKQVKRIEFDRENVTILYADETKDEQVQKAHIRAGKSATAIKGKTADAGTTRSAWYTVDGRRLDAQPKAKGVYMRKEGNRTRKLIKK
jgi:hypothetical protein